MQQVCTMTTRLSCNYRSQSPPLLRLGIRGSFFCTQECFKAGCECFRMFYRRESNLISILSASDKLLSIVLVEYERLNKPFFHILELKLRLLDQIEYGKSNLDKLSMLISH